MYRQAHGRCAYLLLRSRVEGTRGQSLAWGSTEMEPLCGQDFGTLTGGWSTTIAHLALEDVMDTLMLCAVNHSEPASGERFLIEKNPSPNLSM